MCARAPTHCLSQNLIMAAKASYYSNVFNQMRGTKGVFFCAIGLPNSSNSDQQTNKKNLPFYNYTNLTKITHIPSF